MVENKEVCVSIICLVYNHEKYLEQAFEGFLGQKTNFKFEIIIHDDASTDNSALIIKRYQNKHPELFKPIFQKVNQHSIELGRVTRTVYLAAKGKYIALCEGDDFWSDSFKLQKQVNFLERNPDFVLTHHDAIIVNEEGIKISEGKLPEYNKRDFSCFELKKGPFLLTLSLCFRHVIKHYPPELLKLPNGDKILISLLGNYGKGKFMPEIKPAVYRVHRGGVWSSENKGNKNNKLFKTHDRLASYYKEQGDLTISDFHKKKALDLI